MQCKKAAAKLVTTNSPGKHGGHDRVPEGAARGGTAQQSPQARQTGRPGTGQEKENKPRATKTRKMSESSAEKIFTEMGQKCMAEDELVALMAADVNTVVGLLARRGMNVESPDDAAVTALLRSMHSMDNSTDMNLNGPTANNLRALQMQAYDKWKNKAASTGVGGAAATTPASDIEAQEAGKAVTQYNRLAKTTGLTLEPSEHMDYSLMTQMGTLLDQNGTINKRIGLSNIVKQNERKRVERPVGGPQSNLMHVTESTEDESNEKTRYNEVTVKLHTFRNGLAAILSKEISKTDDGHGKLIIRNDDDSDAMYVAGTIWGCDELMMAQVQAIGQYPLSMADSIFRRSFGKVMDLKGRMHFDKAVAELKEHHPSYLRPSEAETREMEKRGAESREKAATKARNQQKAKEEQAQKEREARRAGNHRDVDFATPPHKKQKPEDSGRPACHGQAYSQQCNKDGCTFDHNKARCEAFRAKHPDGPPKAS